MLLSFAFLQSCTSGRAVRRDSPEGRGAVTVGQPIGGLEKSDELGTASPSNHQRGKFQLLRGDVSEAVAELKAREEGE